MTRKLKNWLDSYMEYCDDSEPPELYHKWCGISTIASALQRKCALRLGQNLTFYPNLFVVLVGPPAARKGTAMAFARKLQIAIPKIFVASDSTTREALIRTMKNIKTQDLRDDGTLAVHSSMTIFSTEFTVFTGYKQDALIDALCEWFDCKDKWDIETVKRGNEIIYNVWVNMLAATTPESIMSALPEKAITSGLTSRTIFVVEHSKGKLVVWPKQGGELQALEDDLIADLAEINLINGDFRFVPGSAKAYEDFAYDSDQNPPFRGDFRLEHYAERRRNHVLAIAMCMSAARNGDMIISDDDMQQAIALLKRTELKMHGVFRGTNSQYDKVRTAIEDWLIEQGETTLSRLSAQFIQTTDGKLLNAIIDILIQAKKIERVPLPEQQDAVIRWVV